MFQMLKNCLVKEAVEEDEDGVKDLVDLVLKKLDEDRDGRVSEADWAGAIAKEALLMEAFGQCLPPRKVWIKFKSVLFDSLFSLWNYTWILAKIIYFPSQNKNKKIQC